MRFRICMIILILVGVLTGGIGAGTAIAEFSDMEYEGKVWLGSENTTETRLTYEIEDRGSDRIYCYYGGNMQEGISVIENRKVPLNQIWFDITYNPDFVEPAIESYGSHRDGTESREEVHIWMHSKGYDQMETLMDLKDKILADLKEKKISSYEFSTVVEMNIQVHPSNAEKLVVY